MALNKNLIGEHNITEETFNSTGLTWQELEEIHDDFITRIPELTDLAQMIANSLQKQRGVHSVRYRVKDAEHLISKIIRKRIEDPKRIITISNYLQQVSDLVGVRALHLFKSNWITISKYINDKWDLNETAIAYIREGDIKSRNKVFKDNGFLVKAHPFGYRSLHFIIKSKPNKTEYFAEIQVRTIFEEGWSEIDHKIRYPHNTNNDTYNEFLLIFNRLAGSADEMGSFIQTLKFDIADKEREYLNSLSDKEAEIEKLKKQIDSLTIAPNQREDLFNTISNLKDIHFSFTPKFLDNLSSDKLKTLASMSMDFNRKVKVENVVKPSAKKRRDKKEE